MKGIYLRQAEAVASLKVTLSKFQTAKKDFKYKQDAKGTLLYFIPYNKMCSDGKKLYKARVKTLSEWEQQSEQEIDPVLQAVAEDADFDGGLLNDKLKETRIKKINAEIDYLNQKIQSRKRELFADWSERFFKVFADSFAKFKNSLIDLHLDEQKLNLLKQNLDCSVSSLEKSLSDILNDFIEDKEDEEEKQE